MKPHKGLKSRVKVSANGKVMHKRANGGHLMSGKAGTRKIRIRRKESFKGKFNVNALRALCLD